VVTLSFGWTVRLIRLMAWCAQQMRGIDIGRI